MSKAVPLLVFLKDEAATARFAEDLALALRRRDCVTLSGDLGAGKSTIARAVIRTLANDPDLDVPSPTFTLVQNYDLRIPVAHFDLYRIGSSDEVHELGFDEMLDEGICLVEWPERAEEELPEHQIRIHIEHEKEGRRLDINGPKKAIDRLRRSLAIRSFLDAQGLEEAHRRYLTGDASIRAYEAIYSSADAGRIILMDWPRSPATPPVFDGKPYPKVVHLAEDAYPFVALASVLRDSGLSAPAVQAVDYENGFLLLDDLGNDGVLDEDGRPIDTRYRRSVACLAHLHGLPVRRDIPVTADHVHHIPDFDRTAMLIEARLMVDWHLQWNRGHPATEEERQSYLAVWNGLIDLLGHSEKHLLLRDFHSPNIIWRPEEAGIRQVGIIDFQDAMIGPTAYDVASIIQDARVTIPATLQDKMMDDYLALRSQQPHFDASAFAQDFAIMSAQRNCKLAGLWVRLKERDGKPDYLRHMPRTFAYLESALQHEALSPLRDWFSKVGITLSES